MAKSEILAAMEAMKASFSSYHNELRKSLSEFESRLATHTNIPSFPPPPTESSSFFPLSSATASAVPTLSLLQNSDSPSILLLQNSDSPSILQLSSSSSPDFQPSLPPRPVITSPTPAGSISPLHISKNSNKTGHQLQIHQRFTIVAPATPPPAPNHLHLSSVTAATAPLPLHNSNFPSILPPRHLHVPPHTPTVNLLPPLNSQTTLPSLLSVKAPSKTPKAIQSQNHVYPDPIPALRSPAHTPTIAPPKCLSICLAGPVLRLFYAQAVIQWTEEPPGWSDLLFLIPTRSTVRSFSLQSGIFKKFCYEIPVDRAKKYLVRTTYCYGGVNGDVNLHVFDQIVDGMLWSVVNTIEDYLNEKLSCYEGVLIPRRKNLSVCLAGNTYTNSDPFISSFEVVHLLDQLYNSTAFQNNAPSLVARHNLGYDGPVFGCPDVSGSFAVYGGWQDEHHLIDESIVSVQWFFPDCHKNFPYPLAFSLFGVGVLWGNRAKVVKLKGTSICASVCNRWLKLLSNICPCEICRSVAQYLEPEFVSHCKNVDELAMPKMKFESDNVNGDESDDEGMFAIATGCRYLEKCSRISNAILMSIAMNYWVLRERDVSWCRITDSGVAVLTWAEQLNLQVLSMARCSMVFQKSLPFMNILGKTLVGLNIRLCYGFSSAAINLFLEHLGSYTYCFTVTHPLQELQGNHHLEDKVVLKTRGVDTTLRTQ